MFLYFKSAMSGRYETKNNKNTTDRHETIPAVFSIAGAKKYGKHLKKEPKHNL